MRLFVIAEALNARLVGDGDIEITRVVHPAEAAGDGDLAVAMDAKLISLLSGGKAKAAVLAAGAEPPADAGLKGWIEVGRPRLAMAGLLHLYDRPVWAEPGVHPTAYVDPTATLGEGASIGPFCMVGPGAVLGDGVILQSHVSVGRDARIGAKSLLHAGARIGERVTMGQGCVIQPNAVVGADGFSYVTPEPGSVETAKRSGVVGATNHTILRINSIGSVVLGDNVEIGAAATIDRGTLTDTRIGSGSKIDNLVQVGHNVQIGENCMMCGHVGIAGSVVIGDRVVLAGKVGVADHVTIGSDVLVGAYSGVGQDIPSRNIYMGVPAMPRKDFFEHLKNLRRLRRVIDDVAALKKRFVGEG
jgi:UDP-3-O-[3-hydroxymyristoyl] glucosamine N-acyltransferase